MSYVRLFRGMSSYQRESMRYCPDVIPFEYDAEEYKQLWHDLAHCSYIYFDGISIAPVGIFTYALQTIKGWLGLENNCHPANVAYMLDKLAFYGYMSKFSQPEKFSLPFGYRLSAEIACNSKLPYADEHTKTLQLALLKNCRQSFRSHKFGATWLGICDHKGLKLVPLLDLQDDDMIATLLQTLKRHHLLDCCEFIAGSKFARAAAIYCFNLKPDDSDDYLSQALVFDSTIAQQHPSVFIEYYLAQKKYSAACELLELVDDDTILAHALKIPLEQLQSLIAKDSKIGLILANHYLKSIVPPVDNSFMSVIGGLFCRAPVNSLNGYVAAQIFCTNIEGLDKVAAFVLAIQKPDIDEAYKIFMRSRDVVWAAKPNLCITLAQDFYKLAQAAGIKAGTSRASSNWKDAALAYRSSMIHAKHASNLNKSSVIYAETTEINKRLYASLLVSEDIALHEPEHSDTAAIARAIKCLDSVGTHQNPAEKLLYLKALTGALMRQVDTICEKISFETSVADMLLTDKEQHKNANSKMIDILIVNLKKLISLLHKTEDQVLRLQLAKASYILADLCDFFDINVGSIAALESPSINSLYKLSMQKSPENPCYILRYAELIEDIGERQVLQNRGISILRLSSHSTHDFFNTSDDRWVKQVHKISAIKNMHATTVSLFFETDVAPGVARRAMNYIFGR